MAPMGYRPKSVAASRSRSLLIIEWEDGHHSEYPLAGLRSACPCAECRGGHEKMGVHGSPEMLSLPLHSGPAFELEALERAGTYALQLVWKDGHRYGLYTWDYLRELCPCGEHPARPEG
jgi:DUF971 family protein